jgi:hypothetical protein
VAPFAAANMTSAERVQIKRSDRHPLDLSLIIESHVKHDQRQQSPETKS